MSLFPESLRNLALLVSGDAEARGIKIATAESCTGGLLAALFTDFAGSSNVFERGFVTYSNKAKMELLGVSGDLLADYGAVSEPVARLMAAGALANSRANLALSITGIAGPGGGTALKPVGTVHLACARENQDIIHTRLDLGDIGRNQVRLQTLESALLMIRTQI